MINIPSQKFGKCVSWLVLHHCYPQNRRVFRNNPIIFDLVHWLLCFSRYSHLIVDKLKFVLPRFLKTPQNYIQGQKRHWKLHFYSKVKHRDNKNIRRWVNRSITFERKTGFLTKKCLVPALSSIDFVQSLVGDDFIVVAKSPSAESFLGVNLHPHRHFLKCIYRK